MKLKILFMGTPEFGAIILNGLIENNLKPDLVITEPDKPVGRKQIFTPSPVKVLAEKYNIKLEQPEKILNSRFIIQDSKPDIIIVAAYGQIISKEILKIPKYGCLNVHPSLLPKYRGASPIQTAILNGDKETGITIMLMDEKMDHGEIISNSRFLVSNENYQELSQKLAKIGTELLIKTIPDWVNKEIKAAPQDESKATYTKLLKKEDGKIDWHKTADEIKKQIRAFNPWPSSFTFYNSRTLKIIEAEVANIKANKKNGEVFLTENKELAIQTGQGPLIVRELQLEGKKPMSAKDFLLGNKNIIGSILK